MDEDPTIQSFCDWEPEAEAEQAALTELGRDHRVSSACDSCPARCCSRRFGYTTINLTWEEARDPLFKDFTDSRGNFILEGSRCRFLDPNSSRCTIYEKRPVACRGFVCHDTVNQGDSTIAMVYRDKWLKNHLTKLDLLPPIKADIYWAEDERRTPTGPMGEPFIDEYLNLAAGTWRFYRLEAATGKIHFEGRRRSTKVPFTFGRFRSLGRDLVAACDAADAAGIEEKTTIPETDYATCSEHPVAVESH